MDAVYVLAENGSRWFNNEIRFSIRSLLEHCRDLKNIYIIGYFPPFLHKEIPENYPMKLIHIPHEQYKDFKLYQKNVRDKLLIACETKSISDSFLFMNDDFFFTKDFFAVDLPVSYQGTLADRTINCRELNYKRTLLNTISYLKDANKERRNFELHRACVFKKSFLSSLLTCINWDVENGYAIKSLYFNYYKFLKPFEIGIDAKIRKPALTYNEIKDALKDVDFFSISNSCINDDFEKLLTELYPDPSPWE